MQADESFSFPIELFPSIIEHIHSSSTLASLARVNKTISILANEALYEDVTFETASALVLFYTRVTPQKKLMVRNLTIRHGDTSDPRWQLPPALPRLEPISPTGESSHRMSKLEWLMIFSVESPQSRDNGSPSVGPTRSLTSTGPNALFRLWLPALVPVNGPQGVMAVRVSSETDGGEDEIIDLKACDPALLKLLISVISTWDNVERIMLHEQCLISPSLESIRSSPFTYVENWRKSRFKFTKPTRPSIWTYTRSSTTSSGDEKSSRDQRQTVCSFG